MTFAIHCDYPVIRLKKNEERRVLAGHLWIFSNEIDVSAIPISQISAGSPVSVYTQNGRFLAYGYLNPASLIAIRILSRDQQIIPDAKLLEQRMQKALELRRQYFSEPFYRMVFSESDLLPGLIVDRYDSILVVQITTAGMERMKREIISSLQKMTNPSGILLKNDSSIRQLEGLSSYIETAVGTIPEINEIVEAGVRYRIMLEKGQKTGWFFDQRINRQLLSTMVEKRSVLDLFSYVGAWGIQAAVRGAEKVLCVDSSAQAMELVLQNAKLNEVQDKVGVVQGDAFDVLKQLHNSGQTFDVVVADPPAFIKRKKDFKKGLEAYSRLHHLAMQLLKNDGLLVSCSCSQHLSRVDLQKIILKSAQQLRRQTQILYHGYQSLDHPIHPAIYETEYLKVIFTRVYQL